MNEKFILSCESTVDLPFSYILDNNISVLFYSYTQNGKEIEDNMGRSKTANSAFYAEIKKGNLPATSQINEYKYYEYFNSILKENTKILHIAFGSGMTPSVNNAMASAKRINEENGEEKIEVIDSLCSSSGYGLLVSMARDMQKEGSDINEVKEMLLSTRQNIHHQFFSTDMSFFKRSGRVTGVTATVATILGICPIMHLDKDGKIVAYDKVRGKKSAILKTTEEMLSHAKGGKNYNGKCFISHSNCLDMANELKEEIEKNFPSLKGKTEIYEIGNIIASHCGQGTVALFFIGDERK